MALVYVCNVAAGDSDVPVLPLPTTLDDRQPPSNADRLGLNNPVDESGEDFIPNLQIPKMSFDRK